MTHSSSTPKDMTPVVEMARTDERRVQYAGSGELYCTAASPYQAGKIVLAVNSHAALTKERDDLRRALEHLLANTAVLPGGVEFMRDNPDSRNAISKARAALTGKD